MFAICLQFTKMCSMVNDDECIGGKNHLLLGVRKHLKIRNFLKPSINYVRRKSEVCRFQRQSLPHEKHK